MRGKLLFICAIGILLVGAILGYPKMLQASPGGPQSASASNACDRTCLNNFVDQYLDAVVAHDPSRLPVTKYVKFTENGQKLELGDGFWRTATAKGTYKFYVDDPQAGQVGFEGTMQEAGQPVIVAVRLKVENQKISEIETIVARGQFAQGGAANLEKLGSPRAAFLEDVPAGERASRLDLIKTANKYFSGMQQDDGKHDYSFFGDDCDRSRKWHEDDEQSQSYAGLNRGRHTASRSVSEVRSSAEADDLLRRMVVPGSVSIRLAPFRVADPRPPLSRGRSGTRNRFQFHILRSSGRKHAQFRDARWPCR